MTNHSKILPSLSRAVAIGGVGFSLASLCVFATVAFGERWLYTLSSRYPLRPEEE